MFDTQRFYPLFSGVQHYAWGESVSAGRAPYIAELLGTDPGTQPWAELWLGAHPTLPGQIECADGSRELLEDAIAAGGAEWLGKNTCDASSEHALPFLLKVLACCHPLSIQSHPDEPTAQRLHAQQPKLYPDAHDKTEIIIALKPFEAMAGLRTPDEVKAALNAIKAFQGWRALWQNGTDADNLRGVCTALFALDAVQLAAMLNSAEAEIRAKGAAASDAEQLFLTLSAHYPGDRGTLFAFLLNHLILQPGEALYLAPNTPHAYMDGVGIECMTNSDNVIRAGLTPKAIDVPTLLETVNFESTGACYLHAKESAAADGAGVIRSYIPPTPKFQVAFIEDAAVSLQDAADAIGIFIVLEGAAKFVSPDGCRTAHKGEGFVRPAALRSASIEPLTPGTRIVWAQPGY